MSDSTLPDPKGCLPLTATVLNILLALSDSAKHGYAIRQEVEIATDGKVRMGAGTLYGTIDRMLKAGLIDEVEGADESRDPRRRYYRLSSLGRKALRAELGRLQDVLETARAKRVLSPA
jgi:DNA-binding PadR family transcriptional regulator